MVRLILKEFTKLLIPVTAVYCLLLGLSIWYAPPLIRPIVDSSDASRSVLWTEPAYVTFRAHVLDNPRPAVMILGASNARLGFPPNKLQQRLPGIDFHNLSIGGSNIDGLRAAVELIYANRSPAQRQATTIVLGLWYGMFTSDYSDIARAPVALQMKRFGLYQKAGEGFVRTLPAWLFDYAVFALRPAFFMQNILASNGPLATWWRGDVEYGPKKRPAKQDRPIPTSQFDALVALSERVEALGGNLVLIDMPSPEWFTSSTPMWGRYQAAKGKYFDKVRAHGTKIVDLQAENDEKYFVDRVHPTPLGIELWASRLVQTVDRLPKRPGKAPRSD
jgi:hypothetical protein